MSGKVYKKYAVKNHCIFFTHNVSKIAYKITIEGGMDGMLLSIRNPLTGKLICKWDCEHKMIEIVQHKKPTKVFFQSDGSYQICQK